MRSRSPRRRPRSPPPRRSRRSRSPPSGSTPRATRSRPTPAAASTFDTKEIQQLPLGTATPLNQVILQAPGVVQDSFGQLHVRGDHANLQYRINGVVIPEAISGFGQALDARFADRHQHPHRRAAGAVRLPHRRRRRHPHQGRRASRTAAASATWAAATARRDQRRGARHAATAFSYYLTGSYLRNDLGIENPTPERNAIHDHTAPEQGLRLLLVRARRREPREPHLRQRRQQVPDPERARPDPSFTLAGAPPVDFRATLDARQHEKNHFQVLSLPALAGRRPRLPGRALPPLHRRALPARSRRRPRLQRHRRADPAHATRRRPAGRPRATSSASAHAAQRASSRSRERFDGRTTPRRCSRPTRTATRRATCRSRSRTTASIAGHLFGVYLQDEWTPTPQLTVNYGAALRPRRHRGRREPVEPAHRPRSTTSSKRHAPARRLRALLHAAAHREDRHHLGAGLPRAPPTRCRRTRTRR